MSMLHHYIALTLLLFDLLSYLFSGYISLANTKRKKTFWTRSPSPVGLNATPKRRPREEALNISRNVQRKLDVDSSFLMFKDEVKNSPIALGKQNSDSSAAKAIAKYGLENLLYAIASTRHVPVNFLNRDEYIFKIMKEVSADITKENVEELLRVASGTNSRLLSTSSEVFKTVLWKASYTNNEPYLNFVCPQNSECLNGDCDGKLYPCYKSEITVYKLSGPEPGMKCSLRCRMCKARYHINFYTIPKEGKKFYPEELKPSLKSSSSWTFFTRDTYELMCEAGNHAFVSHKAFAEIYNSVFSEKQASQFYQWQQSNRKKACQNDDENDTDDQVFNTNHFATDETDEDLQGCGMTSKMALNCFFHNELEKEIEERDLTSQTVLSRRYTAEDVLGQVDKLRREELYPHECSENCRKKGCANLRVIDACWKLNMYHCMMAVPQEVKGFPLLSFPNVCVNEPKPGSVFCKEHHDLLTRQHVPTQKDEFLRHVGCRGSDSNAVVEKKVLEFAIGLQQKDTRKLGKTAIEYQGTESIVDKVEPSFWESAVEVNQDRCNKDTGLKAKLRHRSRGHFLCVTGGGHILYFNPLFKSESPSQVFIQTVKVIYEDVKSVPLDKLETHLGQYFLAYDNMCHLDTLKAAPTDLPLPEPYNKLWIMIKKIIDKLHLPNHKNRQCKVKYNPAILPADYNTQAAEQTFSWLSRFKKIVNSMTQLHHLFYLHRMIKRRNLYTAKCRQIGKEPSLPQLRIYHTE